MHKTQNYPLKSASVKVCTLFVLLVKFCALDFNFYDFSGLSTDGQKATFGDLNLYYGLHNKTILIQNKKTNTLSNIVVQVGVLSQIPDKMSPRNDFYIFTSK